ncbi:MAG: D-alanine--D-alanine ligase [Pirellulales bacterium]|nr:D-alanine--D-alanine ligase [Pirellulales bacterium]
MTTDNLGLSLRVAVLCGGHSAERSVSLASGQAVAKALAAAGHDVRQFDPAATPLDDLPWPSIDVCYLALHGGTGEDGTVQQQLERLGVRYTGSGPAASRLAMSKSASKERFAQHEVPTLPYVLVHRGQRSADILASVAALGYPLIFKPDGQGSSLGVAVATGPQQVASALATAGEFDDFVLVEPYVAGREFTVAVWGRQALPVLEIIAPEGLFDYNAKYESAQTRYCFDHRLPSKLVERLERAAIAAAAALDTSGMVRVDVMLDRFECLWVLEVNTSPGMTDHSLVPKAAARWGLSFTGLCDRLVRETAAAGVSP